MNKTPATVLQELCVSQKVDPPFYKLLQDGTNTPDKIFIYELNAFDQTTNGEGRSKKDAKHNAANNMIEQLATMNILKLDSKIEIQNIQSVDGNAVGNLLDLCVERNHPLPKFELLSGAGPSHAPEFTYECVVASVSRRATYTTKKGAKQMVARKMLNILQNMAYDELDRTVATIDSFIDDEDSKSNKKIRTYLEYRNSDVKQPTGVKLCDRHNYFKNFDLEKKSSTRNILFSSDYDSKEKLNLILKLNELEYEIAAVPKTLGKLQMFCLKGDFDCVIVAPPERIYDEVLTYLQVMMGI